MPKMWVEGLEGLGVTFGDLTQDVENALKAAIYDGAHELFTEVQRQIQALPEGDDKSKHRDITAKQKQGLLSGLYGSKITVENGNVYEYISFEGYNDVRTEQYPHGQPNIMIARSVESGASYMNKRLFMTKAKNAARPRALAATKNTFEREISKLNK